MAERYQARIEWQRGPQPFNDLRYSRAHRWRFDGIAVAASSAPQVVALPHSRTDAIDPEEALVAAVASCHMLFFLESAAKAGFRIDDYQDAAVGEMGSAQDGRIMMTKVTLSPQITTSGQPQPTPPDLDRLHQTAHRHGFIANSLRTVVEISARPAIRR